MELNEKQREALKRKFQEKGMIIGMLMFMPVGVAMWLLLGNPGLLGIGPALGISVGVAIGEDLYNKEITKQ
jgi:hypothetical protein